jgi:hypothetical protein
MQKEAKPQLCCITISEQNRMYNLDKKGEGLLIMGKNSTQNTLWGTKKYIQRSSLTKETM